MSVKNKEMVSFFHDYNLYIPTRTITITGEINETLYENVIKNLHFLDSSSGEINIKLNSEGGDVTAARAIFDAIFNCKNHVRIIVYGEASSSASLILQAADERIMSINSNIMLHIGEEAYPSNHPKVIDAIRTFNKKIELWMENVYLDRIKQVNPKFSRQNIRHLLLFDTILTPEEALKLNLIDKIGEVQ